MNKSTSSITPPALRRRPLLVLLGLLGLGAVVATYMAVAHLALFHGTGSFHSICNFGAHLSCDAVNTSDQSELFGVSIAVFALPAYAAMAFLVRAALATAPSDPAAGRPALALAQALAWPAVAYSAYLLAVMIFQLGTLCLFCLTLDAVNVSALALTAYAAGATPRALLAEVSAALGPGRASQRLAIRALGLGIVVLTLALAGHARLRASLEAEARTAATISPSASAITGEPGADEAAPTGGRKLPQKRWEVPVDDDDASVGPRDARVTVVQFADFQCGYCKKLEQGLAAMRSKYAGEVRFVFKHFPMSPRCNPTVQNEKHKYACEAAAAAGECARKQGKFWPMHDRLYARQTQLTRPELDGHAAEVGLDVAAYAACMGDPKTMEPIARDSREGAGLEIHGTPRTFINGRLFPGVLSEDLLDFVIRVELGRVTGKAAEVYVPRPGTAPMSSGAAE